MPRRVIVLVVLLMSLLIPLSVQAQNDRPWEVVVYDGEQLLVITADGISESIALPKTMQRPLPPATSLKWMSLSSDRGYLAFASAAFPDESAVPVTVFVADIAAGTCCVEMNNPLSGGLLDITLGVFNQDHTQFTAVVGYGLPDTTADAMVVVEAVTGAVLHQVDPKALLEGGRHLEFLNWDDDGIHLLPIGSLDTGELLDTHARIWKPETDDVLIDATRFDGYLGDWLPGTHEYLRRNTAADFVAVGDERPPLNVVEVIRDGDETSAVEVLRDPNNRNINNPHWVLDGNAYLTFSFNSINALIHRDGTVQEFVYDGRVRFIAGTPDGWLMQQTQDDRALIHYTVQDGEIIADVIDTFTQGVIVLHKPDLGASVRDEFMHVELDVQ